MRKLCAFVWCFTLLTLSVSAQKTAKYSQVKIYVQKEQMAELQRRGLDLDHSVYNSTEGSLTTTLESAEIAVLKSLSVRYTITIDDEEEDFKRRNDPKDFFKYDKSPTQKDGVNRLLFNSPNQSFTDGIITPTAFNMGSMGGYYTLAEIKKELDSMKLNYPTLVKIDTIGWTHRSRPIWAVTISDNAAVNENEPEILYTAMHHAREPLGMESLIFFMQYLLQNYSVDNRIKEIVNNRELVFIPCVNPDGYRYNDSTNTSGGGLWRKNRQPNSDGTFGQDLNRNYSFGWNDGNNGSSTVTSNDTYRGDSAFAAIETRLMKHWLRTKDFKYALNYHSYGGYWIHGYCVSSGTLSSTDSAIIKTTSALASKHNIYKVGTPIETVGYNGRGSSDDFFLGGDIGFRPPIYAISPEVGLGLATFWPNASTIIGYCKEVFFSNLQAALFAGSYVDVQDRGNIALTTTTGNFDFQITRIGRVDSSVKITVLPLENIRSIGGPVTVSSIPDYLGTTTVSVSYTLHTAIANGYRVRFAVKTETGGVTKVDTIIKYFNPDVLFTDNAEGTFSNKWTSTSWGYSNKSAFAGSNSMTESPSGNYGANATLTAQITSAINLTGSKAAYLTFWTRYRTQNGYDKLQIQVSTNNGSTYTALPGTYTIVESKGTLGSVPALTGYQDYWVKEVVDLSAYITQSALRVRFEFTSDGSAAEEGFFIDDVQIMRTTQDLVVLPMRFNDVKAVKSMDGVTVRWEASIDANHEYFEVERSADGVHFTPFHKTTDRTAVQYAIDRNVITGTIYYRIKAIGKGGITYSKTVTVAIDPSRAVALYPNPVIDKLTLEMNGNTPGTYQVQVVSTSGQVVSYKEVIVSGSQSRVSLDMTGVNKGNYIVCIKTETGELVDVRSFIKL